MLRAKPKSTPALVDDNREKDVHEDMHPKVEFVENDDDRAARVSVRQLLEGVHAAATAKKEAETDGAVDTDAHFEQWCSSTALLLLVGEGGLDDKVLTDVLAPQLDSNRVLLRYEPKQLQVEARRRRSGQKSERRGEQSEERKEGERSEEKKEGERSEEEEMKDESFPFPDDDLASFVAPLLQDIHDSEHPDVAQAVIDNVVGAKGLSGIELANTALQLAFDGTRHEWLPYVYTGGDGGDSAPKTTLPLFSELTPLQQSAVSAVAHVDNSCWKFANFKATLKSWGLPGDKIELEKYIDGKEFGKDAVEEESPEKKQRIE